MPSVGSHKTSPLMCRRQPILASGRAARVVVQQRATACNTAQRPTFVQHVPHFWTYVAVIGHEEIAFTQRVVLRCFRGRSSEAEHQLPKLADTHSYAQYLDVIDRLGLGA